MPSPDAARLPLSDVIIVPVHNRRETTLACLRTLRADGVMGWAELLVVDDGSTDGTSEAIGREFPAVSILHGDGTWWWAGAIRRGMEWALARGARQVIWLNDDCSPPAGALRRLRDQTAETGAVGWIEAATPSGWSYGGHRKTAFRVRRCTAQEEARGKIDAFSGNCVCLPRTWIERIGLPHDHLFPHGLADLDYGLRLRAAGAPFLALASTVAASGEPARAATESWLASRRPMRDIWQDFSSPRSFFHFPAWRRFAFRHWGPWWGAVVFVTPYGRWGLIAGIRAIAPRWARSWSEAKLKSPSGRERAPS